MNQFLIKKRVQSMYKFESRNTAIRRRTTANMYEIKNIYKIPIFRPAMQDFFRAVSSNCGVPALKLINELSLQASSDPMSDIGIVSFSSSIQSMYTRGPNLPMLPPRSSR